MNSGPQSEGPQLCSLQTEAETFVIFVAQMVLRTRYGVSSKLSTSTEWIKYSIISTEV